MTRTPHDQFAKQYLAELLSALGEVNVGREVSPEVREVDIWFVPHTSPTPSPQVLGLLGQMAASACLLEPFRNPPSPTEVRNCLLKLYSLDSELLRKARREQTSLTEVDLPRLWILSPSCSQRLLTGFNASLDTSENWTAGVYFLGEFLRTAFVAINELPIREETLWLRLLGRGITQRQAVEELVALPQGHPLKRNILEIVANWRISVSVGENLNNDDQELLMNLSPAYLQWREATLQEGRQEGQQEGRQQMVENFLRARFGEIDATLSPIVAPLLQLPPEELAPLLLTLSREELIARFGE
ncbi:hypothetical protein QQ054_28600 [Oscillatoria amoena NRMC-F 0135]|nr:hypothetical protein [Geitlerinema splendidum]MDL5049977.1 hypothetical protein [Oscillatoria amoena NRMC-F 0135]